MAASLAALDQTGPLWASGALVGKVGSVFTGSATQHGGQESTILTMIPTLLHHGMIVVGREVRPRRDFSENSAKRPRSFFATRRNAKQP